MNRLREIIREIHRRSLWQVVGIYLVGSWLGYQVILGVTDGLSLPDWVPPLAFVLFVIGLPIVVATAFINEGPPGLRPRDPTLLPGLEPGAQFTWEHTADFDRTAADDASATSPAAAAPPALHALTWRRALGAGVGAFLALGVGAGGYAGMRVAGIGPAGTLIASGRLQADAPILLAEFRAVGVDTLLARALTEALRVDLEQSRVVTLAQPSFISDGLRRMQLDPHAPLDEATARTLAMRDGLGAVVTGEVAVAAGQWVVTTRIVEPASGAALASYRETVSDSTRVVDALGRTSRKLRAKIGESLRDVRASEPLAQVTTPSLEALRAYSQAMHLAPGGVEHRERVITLLEQAIAYDSAFAMAYRKLGIEYGNDPFHQARAAEMLMKAHQYIDRLSEPERYITLGSYHGVVTLDRDQQLAAYQTLYQLYPTFPGAATNYGFALSVQRRFDRAADAFRDAVALDTMNALPLSNYVVALVELGRLEDAESALGLYRRRFPANLQALNLASIIASVRGEHEQHDSLLVQLQQQATGPTLRMLGTGLRFASLGVRGRFAAAEPHILEGRRIAEQVGSFNGVYMTILFPAMARLASGAAPAAPIVADVDAVLARFPLEDAPLLDRPYLDLAVFYAMAGQAGRARAFVTAYRQQVPAERQRGAAQLPAAEGMIALAEGRYRDAVRLFEAAHANAPCSICYLAPLASAYDHMDDADATLTTYQRYLETPSTERRWEDAIWRGHVLERVAQLHDEAGRVEDARRYYAQLVELWSDADAPLRPRVEAARERIAVLMPGG